MVLETWLHEVIRSLARRCEEMVTAARPSFVLVEYRPGQRLSRMENGRSPPAATCLLDFLSILEFQLSTVVLSPDSGSRIHTSFSSALGADPAPLAACCVLRSDPGRYLPSIQVPIKSSPNVAPSQTILLGPVTLHQFQHAILCIGLRPTT